MYFAVSTTASLHFAQILPKPNLSLHTDNIDDNQVSTHPCHACMPLLLALQGTAYNCTLWCLTGVSTPTSPAITELLRHNSRHSAAGELGADGSILGCVQRRAGLALHILRATRLGPQLVRLVSSGLEGALHLQARV